ncbi:hypothetical protein [uncultured Paraglaciecola sp.]|uniref:hypothetical protein n=1 Tax=uncultured Paraglaciecola sp. TaxID=1765024 RepID=UPI0030DC1A44
MSIIVSLSGCSSDGATAANSAKTNVPSHVSDLAAMPVADYEVLFIGNSHSSANGLPNLVAILLESAESGKTANAALAAGYGFLDERVNDGVTEEALKARQWTHVFLQAQKYSTTGRYFYPTLAAQTWIKSVKSLYALPIMFPEWPRYANKEEGQRIFDLHLSIVSQEAACVAPVGLVWDASIKRHPDIKLHAVDGNHSNLNGALLTAYVFFQIISTQPANVLEYIPEIGVNEVIQAKLKAVALDFHNLHLPCP